MKAYLESDLITVRDFNPPWTWSARGRPGRLFPVPPVPVNEGHAVPVRNTSEEGRDLVSLSEKIDTTSASGKMVFRLLAVLNEFERDQISDRTRFALAHKKANGEKTGGTVPFGYKVDPGSYIATLKNKNDPPDP